MLTTQNPPARETEHATLVVPTSRKLIGPVLAATDGSPASDGAVRIAYLLATRNGVPFRVLPVLEPAPFPVSLVLPGWAESSEDARKGYLLDCVKAQLERVRGIPTTELPEVELGRPSDVITRVAHAAAASITMVGVHRHGYVGQTIGEETALEVMRQATLPVLAAADTVSALPRRAMVAVDFSQSSVRAARAALSLVADGGTVTLVHIQPSTDYFAPAGPAWGSIYSSGATALLDRLCRELSNVDGVQVEAEIVAGAPAPRLLEVAKRGAFDLIAAGSHGPGLIERFLIGSVATQLVRGAECSVLVAPAPTGDD